MKKVFYGPYYRTIIRMMHGKKIIGKASKDELRSLFEIVAKDISKIDSKKTKEEIFNLIIKKAKLIYTEQLPVFSGVKGLNSMNTIFVDKSDVDEVLSSSLEDLVDNTNYNTIIHECIHKLQAKKLIYIGKSIRGFMEGATELMTLRANSKDRSFQTDEFSANFPGTSYIKLVSIIAQLEVIYGKDCIEQFSLSPKDFTLIDKVQELLGKENYEELRKDMNADARGKISKYTFYSWQNILLTKHFNKEISSINSQEEAEHFLEKLKEMQNVRINVADSSYYNEYGSKNYVYKDNFYKEYYLSKLEYLKNQYPNIDIEKYQYKECEFYPTIYKEEKVKKFNKLMMNIMCCEELEDFRNLKLEDYKRYILPYGDKTFQIVTNQNKVTDIRFMDKTGTIISCLIDLQRRKVNLDDIIRYEDGKAYAAVNLLLPNEDPQKKETEEIPIGFSKKDIYSRMLEEEQLFTKHSSFLEKLKVIFIKQKRLPPYSEVIENEKSESPSCSWKLTDEQRKNLEMKHTCGQQPLVENGNNEHESDDDLNR